MTDKLKRCPVCRGEGTTLTKTISEDKYWISCSLCHASTNCYNTPDEAIAAWNQRAGGEDKTKYETCPECFGDGEKSEMDIVGNGDVEYHATPCANCSGTGKVTKRAGGKKQARIAELEAELAEAKHDADLFKRQFNTLEPRYFEARDRVVQLEAQLPKEIGGKE
jgi:hypothetical protein